MRNLVSSEGVYCVCQRTGNNGYPGVNRYGVQGQVHDGVEAEIVALFGGGGCQHNIVCCCCDEMGDHLGWNLGGWVAGQSWATGGWENGSCGGTQKLFRHEHMGECMKRTLRIRQPSGLKKKITEKKGTSAGFLQLQPNGCCVFSSLHLPFCTTLPVLHTLYYSRLLSCRNATRV